MMSSSKVLYTNVEAETYWEIIPDMEEMNVKYDRHYTAKNTQPLLAYQRERENRVPSIFKTPCHV